MHAFVARLPQTSQSRSAEAGPEGGEGSAETADEEEPGGAAAAEAADKDADKDAAGEGGVGAEGVVNAGDVAEVDGPVAALGGFPPFFFVMGWCMGFLEARWAVAGAVAASVPRTRGPSAEGRNDEQEATTNFERTNSSVVAAPEPATKLCALGRYDHTHARIHTLGECQQTHHVLPSKLPSLEIRRATNV